MKKYSLIFLFLLVCLSQVLFSQKLDEALQYHDNGEHWNALKLFSSIESNGGMIPKDTLYYYWGMTYHQMFLDSNASEMFQKGITAFPNSPLKPYCCSGLQRIAYRYGNSAKVKQYHEQLKTMNAPQELMDASLFYYGTHRCNKGNYALGENAFKSIDSTSLYFEYGQLQSLFSVIRQGDLNDAEKFLNECYKRLVLFDGEVLELQNEVLLKLAYIAFELGTYERAIELFNMIDSSSLYYREALLGLSWTYFKLGIYRSALESLQIMNVKFPHSPYQVEVSYLSGICYIAIKDYGACDASFKRVADLAKRDSCTAVYNATNFETIDKNLEAAIAQFFENSSGSQARKEIRSLKKRHGKYLREIDRYVADERDQKIWRNSRDERIRFIRETSYSYKKINFCTCGYPMGECSKKQPQTQEQKSGKRQPQTQEQKSGMTPEEIELMKQLERLK